MAARTPNKLTRWIGTAAGIAVVCGGIGAAACGLADRQAKQALKHTSLTSVRLEALSLFPRGSEFRTAADHLATIGFRCEPIDHPLPDISGPTLRCASNGRGYPDYPAVNIIVMTRNGLVSDVDVWNVMARADGDGDDIDFTATGSTEAMPFRRAAPTSEAGPDAPLTP